MAEADAENRRLAQQSANRANRVLQRLRIAGTVGEKHAVGLAGQHFFGRGRAGQDRHAAAHVEQMPGDVPLHAVIQGHDVRRAGIRWRSDCRFSGHIEGFTIANRSGPRV